jgi:hypothetical protein
VASLLNQGCDVIIGNWFSCPDLFINCGKQADAVGTLDQNRKGVTGEIKSTKLKKGEHVSIYEDRLMIMKW